MGLARRFVLFQFGFVGYLASLDVALGLFSLAFIHKWTMLILDAWKHLETTCHERISES